MIYLLIIFFIFIIGRPLSAEIGNDLLKVLPLALLMLGIFHYGVHSRQKVYIGKVFNTFNFFLYVIFLLIFSFSFLRDSEGESSLVAKLLYALQYTLFPLFIYLFIMKNTLQRELDFLRRSIFYLIMGMSLFLVVELMLFSLGVGYSHGGSKKAVLAAMLGLNVNRSAFLLGGHHNSFALYIGSTLSMAIFYLLFLSPRQKYKIALFIIIGIASFLLLVSDVRGVAFSIIIALVVIYSIRKILSIKLIPWLAFVPLAITLSIPTIQELLLTLGSDAIAQVSRKNNDFLTFNNRTNIWLGLREGLSDFSLEHLVGYGQTGHISSGLYKFWLDVMPFRVTHNVYYQLIADIGYIGLAIFLLLIFRSLKDCIQLYTSGYKESIVLIGFIIYFIFASMFESSIGIYNHPQTSVFLVFVFLPILLKNANQYYFYRVNNDVTADKPMRSV